jgi:HK97 family phage major capsid protein
MTMLELRAKRADLFRQAKELTDKTDYTKDEVDALIAQADELAREIQQRERLDVEIAALDKSTGRAVSNAKSVSLAKLDRGENEGSAFEHWIRTGDAGGIKELRASNATDMNIGTAADGQYLVPTGHYQGIIARRDEAMLANQVGVQKFTGKGTTLNVPIDDEADGEFVVTSEASEFDLDAPATNKVALTKLMYTKQVKLSYQLLEDEDSNLMEFLTNFVGRGLAKTHNSLFITEALANGTASLTLDAAAAIGPAEIPELLYKQQAEYIDGSVWIMNRTTEGYIRGLLGTSTTDGFLFNPNPAGSDHGKPEIWGHPVYNTAKMTALGASVKSLLFGNFNFMGLYEDPSLTFLRDPYSLAAYGQVRLLYYFRADYGVLQAEAIHYATHPSA